MLNKNLIVALTIIISILAMNCFTRPADLDAKGRQGADRGDVLIYEVNWAGSVSNYTNCSDLVCDSDGVRSVSLTDNTQCGCYYPDDDFIEFQSHKKYAINMEDWYVHVKGNVINEIFRFPAGSVVPPINDIRHDGIDGIITLANSTEHAFPTAHAVDTNLSLHNADFYMTLYDWDNTRIDDWGSRDFSALFAGALSVKYDSEGNREYLSTKSMMMTCEKFSEDGGSSPSWFTFYGFSTNNALIRIPYLVGESKGGGDTLVADGFKDRTFATPSWANQERPTDDCENHFM